MKRLKNYKTMQELKFRVVQLSERVLIGWEWHDRDGWKHMLCSYSPASEIKQGVIDTTEGIVREQFTSFYEVNSNPETYPKNELYVGDKIYAQDVSNKAAELQGIIVFDNGCFSLRISKTNAFTYCVGQTALLCQLTNFKILHE